MERDVWIEVAMPMQIFEALGLMEPAWVMVEGVAKADLNGKPSAAIVPQICLAFISD